jgi:RecA-family ATPase
MLKKYLSIIVTYKMFCKLNSSVRFYSIILIASVIGVGTGLAMIFYSVTEYEILFTTINTAITLAILYNQHHSADNQMPKKQWQVNMGLVEGYDIKNSKIHTIEEVHEAFKKWIISRKKIKSPILSGSVQYETMIYPYGDNDAILEPSAVIKGELSPKFDKHRHDYEVIETIKSLAIMLLIDHGQTRVYYSYCNVQYTVDKKDITDNVVLAVNTSHD